MTITVLLTGFGRFPGAPFNPTGPLVQRLARRRRPALADIGFITHVFDTSYAAVDRDLPTLLAHRPALILMFGLAARSPHVRIETRARNTTTLLLPDAGGARPGARVIAPGKPAALSAASDARQLLRAARAAGMPARLSRDAGGYLCNYAYWRMLDATAGTSTLVQFVHVPALPRGPRPRPAGSRGRLTLAALVRAAEAMLVALAAASRH